MICFIVPVKSKIVSNDWPYFSKLVERTMRSLCNQDSLNFEIILVCHEAPEIDFFNEKIHKVHVDFDPPQLKQEESREDGRMKKEIDKAKKIKFGEAYANKFNPDFLMVVDSDDLISNQIVSFVEQQPENSPGWYIEKGYNYKEGSSYVFYKNRTFNHLCGSTVIIRKDLLNELFITNPWLFYVHETTELSNGEKLMPIPFPGAIYSIANGENHFMSPGYAGKVIKRYIFDIRKYLQLFEKISKYRIRFINKKFRKTFNFYQLKE
jgi:hypothetical protein